jgi:predicted ester cyclase
MSIIENEIVVRGFIESFDNAYDLESARKFLTNNCEIIYPNLSKLNKEDYLKDLKYESTAFSNVSIKIDFIVSKGNKVVTECSWIGTRTGEYRGIEPSNVTYEAPGVFIFEVENGKITLLKYYWNPTLYVQ